jgi:hypothetical protein
MRAAVANAGGATPGGALWESDHEPDLDSVLADPIVALVMDRDGVSRDDVAGVVDRARALLRGRPI